MFGHLVLLAGLASALLSPPATAQRFPVSRVAIADVDAQGKTRAAEALHRTLTAKLRDVQGVRITPAARAQFIIRGSITKLKRSVDHGQQRVDCKVSVVVSDTHGTIRMILNGAGAAKGTLKPQTLAQQALDAATQSALRPMQTSLLALR